MTDRITFGTGKHIHRIEQKDTARLLGLCARCGVVQLKRIVRKKYTQYQCMTSYREGVAAQSDRVRGWKSHGLSATEAADFISDKVCNICKTDDDLCVDHSHETQRLRGALCRLHNSGLGMFGDDPALLRRAADYLEGKLPIARSSRVTVGEARYVMNFETGPARQGGVPYPH